MSKQISISLATLEHHNHIVGDIARGIKLFERGGVEYINDANLGYIAVIPEKGEHRRVVINFTHDGADIESFFCNKCVLRNSGAICRHVVAGVLAIQGGIVQAEADVRILSIRDNPEYLDRAADYFSAKWSAPRVVYQDSISNSMHTETPLPRWYLLISNAGEIIGSYGLITNDFTSRQDLWPWICALYVEASYRGNDYGAKMLAHGRLEAKRLGFEKLYLCTEHIGYYEKYGWAYIGVSYSPDGQPSRLYEICTK